ncbi:MAG: hypothetical protein VXW87_00750 [Pseudomonadota bacterium]|nr:hypothetical protein [Pseudomonadota bacterium]
MQNRNETSSGDQSSPRPNDSSNSGSHTPTQPTRRPVSISTPIKNLMRSKYNYSPDTPLSGNDKLIVQSCLTSWLSQSGVCYPPYLEASKDIISKLSSLYINVSELYALFGLDFKLHNNQDMVIGKQLHIIAIDQLIQNNEDKLKIILGLTREQIENAIIASTGVEASKQEAIRTYANFDHLVTAVKNFLVELTKLNTAVKLESSNGEETLEQTAGKNVQLAQSSKSQLGALLPMIYAAVGVTAMYISMQAMDVQLPTIYTLIAGGVSVAAFHHRELTSQFNQMFNWYAQQAPNSDPEGITDQANCVPSNAIQESPSSMAQSIAISDEAEAQETTNDRSGGEESTPSRTPANNS